MVSMPVPHSETATTDENLLQIQKEVDLTYKNLLENFDPATKQVVLSGKQLFKAFLNLNEASKIYVDSLDKLASTGRDRGETVEISTSLSEICNAWKEINRQHEEIISFMGTQVLAPTETNLDHDAKVLTEQWKGFLRGQRTIEKRINSSRKKGIPVNGITEELVKLKTDGLQKAADEEKKRYLFVLERHIAVVTLYIKLHKQALQLLEFNVPKWRGVLNPDSSDPEAEEAHRILNDLEANLESPVGTQNARPVDSNGEDSHSTSASSVSAKKSSSNPSPVPSHREPDDRPTELKLLHFKPMPESMKPLMAANLTEEPVNEPIVIKVHEEVPYQPPVPVHTVASTQTDTVKEKRVIPEQTAIVSNGSQNENIAPQWSRAAVFNPPPPPPVLPTEIIHHVVVEAVRQSVDPPIYTVANRPLISNSNFNGTNPVGRDNMADRPRPLNVQTLSGSPQSPPLPLNPMPPPPPKEMWKTSVEPLVEGYAEAVYPYNANGPHQLSFDEGDGIKIMQEGRLGWQYGENDRTKNRGWYPASFVKSVPKVKNPSVEIKSLPVEERAVKSPVPSQPRHSPDPPPLLRLKQFEPKVQHANYPTASPPKIVTKQSKPVVAPPTLPVIEQSKPLVIENSLEPSVVVISKPERPDLHITNFDTIPKNNPFAGVKLRKVLLEGDGKPKKYQ